MRPPEELPDWERLLAAERHLQHIVPGTVLVGGTAAAVHARHRVSLDGDHVLSDLRDRFDDVLARLESVAGWQTERTQRPLLILDTVVLFERLGESGVRDGLSPFDEIYAQSGGASPLAEVAERLAAAAPHDLSEIDLASYRGLRAPWNDWAHIVSRGRAWAPVVARVAMEGAP